MNLVLDRKIDLDVMVTELSPLIVKSGLTFWRIGHRNEVLRIGVLGRMYDDVY